jgi:hypothetical protein
MKKKMVFPAPDSRKTVKIRFHTSHVISSETRRLKRQKSIIELAMNVLLRSIAMNN